MWRAEERAYQKGKGVGDVRRIWENTGSDQRVEEPGLRAFGGKRVKRVMTEKPWPDMRED